MAVPQQAELQRAADILSHRPKDKKQEQMLKTAGGWRVEFVAPKPKTHLWALQATQALLGALQGGQNKTTPKTFLFWAPAGPGKYVFVLVALHGPQNQTALDSPPATFILGPAGSLSGFGTTHSFCFVGLRGSSSKEVVGLGKSRALSNLVFGGPGWPTR